MSTIRNPITLNNSDGYSEKQKDILNSMIMAERNRWAVKSKQTTNKASISEGIDELSGLVSASRSYGYNHIVTMNFTLNVTGLSENKIPLIVAKDTIVSAYITGNCNNPYTSDGEIGQYVSFSISDKTIYAELIEELPEDSNTVFDCNLVMEI